MLQCRQPAAEAVICDFRRQAARHDQGFGLINASAHLVRRNIGVM
jgi:hypothetical protein